MNNDGNMISENLRKAKSEDGVVKIRKKGGKIMTQEDAGMELAKREAVSDDSLSKIQTLSEGEIKAAVYLARQYPRNEMESGSKLIESCKRLSFAENASYSFPRGGRNVYGASINIAREAGRIWKNIIWGFTITLDTEDKRGIKCWAFDVESNVRVSVDDVFSKLIYRKDKGHIKADDRDLRELTNKQSAIGIRNCLLQLIPKDIIEDALMQCKKTLAEKINIDPKESIKKLIEGFKNIGVSISMLSDFIGRDISLITSDEIIELRAIWKSIDDGASKISEYFSKDNEKIDLGTVNLTNGEITDKPKKDKV